MSAPSGQGHAEDAADAVDNQGDRRLADGRRLVLASSSRWRAELLARLELPFVARAPDYDERREDGRFLELGAAGFAAHLAAGKAASLRASFPDDWILAADQLAVLDDAGGPQLLHKPGTPERAVAQLMRLRGRSHRLVTAVILAGPEPGQRAEAVDEQRLTMRRFGQAEARGYVERHRPLASVGAYHIEDAGIRLFERIEGEDYTGIIGLPLLAVCRLLRRFALLP